MGFLRDRKVVKGGFMNKIKLAPDLKGMNVPQAGVKEMRVRETGIEND